MTRTCSDCPAPISRRSKGRCKRCAMAAVNRRPEKRALCSAIMTGRQSDPEFMAKLDAARPKAHARSRATRLSWCPPSYWSVNAALAKKGGYPLEERKRLITEMIEADKRRAVQAVRQAEQRMLAKHERDQRDAY